MKSILISIQPKWCELIASGNKTVEVRKTRPKIETPFKVYIYQTKTVYISKSKENDILVPIKQNMGKVIGEFVCDKIYPIKVFSDCSILNWNYYGVKRACLSLDEVAEYIGANKTGYGWHISNLVIYDKPKELNEFFHYCGDNPKCEGCEAHYYSSNENGTEDYCCSVVEGCKPLKRPFQSWGYVYHPTEKGGVE